KAGMPRAAFLDFINHSVMGSMFTRYKSPAFVRLDFTPTFTPVLLRKDFDLGMTAATDLGVPMPVVASAREPVQAAVAQGRTEEDFAVLLELQAGASGYQIMPEDVPVDDGLGEPGQAPRRPAGEGTARILDKDNRVGEKYTQTVAPPKTGSGSRRSVRPSQSSVNSAMHH